MYNAPGTFEAVEIIVPAEANGIIRSFNIREGQTIDSGIQIGYIDSTQLYLKKKQLESQVKAMGYKLPDIYTGKIFSLPGFERGRKPAFFCNAVWNHHTGKL